jgi:hypothetical protein
VVEARSVLTVVAPRPGKCLTVVATPPSCQPAIASVTAPATAAGSVANARLASAAPATLGTSATGASVTLTPVAFMYRAAVAAPSWTVCVASCSPADSSGPAHESVRTSPPSWSAQTMASGIPSRSLAVSRASWPGETTLSRNRITPAARPSRSTRRTYPGGCVPSKRRMTMRPTCCSSDSRSTAARAFPAAPVAAADGPPDGVSPPRPAPRTAPSTNAASAASPTRTRRRCTAAS